MASELEHLLNKKADLEEEIKKEEHSDVCKTLARDIFTVYSSFYAAGFTQEQAWYFTKRMFEESINDWFNSL